jgi:iron complex outermembrane receptor protein
LFQAQLNGSYTLAYDITTDKGAKIDGVGSRNSGNSIGRPLPQYKANLNLRWMYDIHSLIATIRHVDDYEDDTPQSALRGSYGFFAPTIDSHTELDLQYSMQMSETGVFGGSSIFVFGIKNLTNEEPPVVNVDGGFDYFTHDPRGRIVYCRLTWSI